MLSRPHFHSDTLPTSAVRLHAQNCSGSGLEAACPPPSRKLSGKQRPKGLRVAQDTSCLHAVSPCSAQGASRQTSTVGPLCPGIQRGYWLQSIPYVMDILCWYCKLQPPPSRGQEGTERKSCPDRVQPLFVSLFGFKWLRLNVLIKSC